VQKLLRKARKGTRPIYVTGSYDEALRHETGMHFGGVQVANERLHATADGRRPLVVTAISSTASCGAFAGWRCSATGPTAWRSGSTTGST